MPPTSPTGKRQDSHDDLGETSIVTSAGHPPGGLPASSLLPGRSETIELWPLSQGEIDRTSEGFVDAVFEFGQDLAARPSTLHRSDYLQRALTGGYPEAVRRTDLGRRARFFESAASDLISRDVRQLSDIGRPADMCRLLGAVAAQMASLVVPGTLAGRLQIPANTLKRYLDLLELLYVVHRIPAWSTNLTTRAVATPKMIVTDSGLAGHLAGMTLKRATRPHGSDRPDPGELRAQ